MIPTGDENIKVEKPVVNTLIILVNVIVFIITVVKPSLLVPGAKSLSDVVDALGMKPYFIVRGELLWTIFTAMFIHAGLLHILGNMLYLYVFGDNVEAVFGKLRYLLFYFLCGLGAVLFHIVSISVMSPKALLNYAFSGINPWLVPAIGASGAISGVLGAYFILFPRSLIRTVGFWFWIPIFLRIPASIFILIWFGYQFIMGMVSLTGVPTGVAFWAHVGGFLTGMALTPILADKNRIRLIRAYVYTMYHERWF